MKRPPTPPAPPPVPLAPPVAEVKPVDTPAHLRPHHVKKHNQHLDDVAALSAMYDEKIQRLLADAKADEAKAKEKKAEEKLKAEKLAE